MTAYSLWLNLLPSMIHDFSFVSFDCSLKQCYYLLIMVSCPNWLNCCTTRSDFSDLIWNRVIVLTFVKFSLISCIYLDSILLKKERYFPDLALIDSLHFTVKSLFYYIRSILLFLWDHEQQPSSFLSLKKSNWYKDHWENSPWVLFLSIE